MFQRISDPTQAERIFHALTPNCEQCLYLYCNLERYGVFSEKFQVYFDEESHGVIGVYYGDSMHIFSAGGINAAIQDFIKFVQPRTIFASVPLTGIVDMDEEVTGVYQLDTCQLPQARTAVDIEMLHSGHIGELTDFLYANSEEYRKTYQKEKLREQLLERLQSGYCRYFGCFDNRGALIGCAFTKAEISSAMIVGGILVSPQYRGRGIGKALCIYKGKIAQEEKKNAYCFIDDANHASIKLHESIGYRKVSTVFKYTAHKNCKTGG